MKNWQPTAEANPDEVGDLTIVVVSDTPYIASAVIDSLPTDLPYFLVGPSNIAFLRHSKWCRQYFRNDLSLEEHDKTHFVRTIERIDSLWSNVFLIPVDDSANRIIRSTFDCLGVRCFPMPNGSSFEMLNDKWRFNRHCSNLGVRVPKSIYLSDKAEIDFDYVRAMVGLPFVLKPTNKCNNLGVSVIRSKEQLHNEILSNRQYNFSPLIAQTFIPGVDIDISVFARDGHIINFAVQTRKENTLRFVQNEQLVKFVETIVRDLCYTGVIHIDARTP